VPFVQQQRARGPGADEIDCPDGSDEKDCGGQGFLCGSGETIPEEWVCDFFQDCQDGSDEVDCPGFLCGSGETIPLDWVCDVFVDCLDGSDEENC